MILLFRFVDKMRYKGVFPLWKAFLEILALMAIGSE